MSRAKTGGIAAATSGGGAVAAAKARLAAVGGQEVAKPSSPKPGSSGSSSANFFSMNSFAKKRSTDRPGGGSDAQAAVDAAAMAAAMLPASAAKGAPRDAQLEALQAQEKATLQALRALRTNLAALRMEEESERRQHVEALKAQKKSASQAAFTIDLPGAEQHEMVVLPAELRGTHNSVGASGAKIEAKSISKELENGKMLVFRYDSTSVAATELAATGQPTGGQDRMLYTTLDPSDLDLIDLSGDGGYAIDFDGGTSPVRSRYDAHGHKSATGQYDANGLKVGGPGGSGGGGGGKLKESYDKWRTNYSASTKPADWRRGLETLSARQQERYLATLTLLEVEHPDDSVVALFRIHDLPPEFTAPIKFGDVLLVWSPHRDGGHLTFVDRATTNAVTVNHLATWLEKYRGANVKYRGDSATTDQEEGSSVAFDHVYRRTFQAAKVF